MSREEDLGCATTDGPEVSVAPPVEEDPICVTLSERDADRLLEILNDPPPTNEVARQAAERYKQKYGR
jgi:uncharacterized protein (DUF1778 family)